MALNPAYVNESVLYLQYANKAAIISGLTLCIPISICLSVPFFQGNFLTCLYQLYFDIGLRCWSLFGILLCILQIHPLRYDLWTKFKQCYHPHYATIYDYNRLVYILNGFSWRWTKIHSLIMFNWITITILCALIRKFLFELHSENVTYFKFYCINGDLSQCILRWSTISIFIFLSHFVFILRAFVSIIQFLGL